jgi:hypothetical protein
MSSAAAPPPVSAPPPSMRSDVLGGVSKVLAQRRGGIRPGRRRAHQRGERHADVRRAAAPPQPLNPSAIGITATAAGTLRRALCRGGVRPP